MYEPFCHGQDGFFNTIRKMAQDRREPSAVHVVGNMDWDGLHRPQIYYAMVAIFFWVVPFGHRRHDMQRGLAHDCASVANLFL